MFLQFVYDFLLSTRFDRLELRFIRRTNAPIVRYSLRGIPIWIPWTHNLPHELKRYPQYSDNTSRIGALVKRKYSKLTFIDIGANIGDTAIMQRHREYYPILCIEADESFLSLLRQNTSGLADVWVVHAYVGATNEELQVSSTKYLGSASVVGDHSSGRSVTFRSLDSIVREHSKFSHSKMVKIDTDGFDLKIIRGAREFLKRAKPVLFFEYDPYFLSMHNDDGLSIFPFLKSLGYEKLLVYDNLGDYLMSTHTSNRELLRELHAYFSGRKGNCYADMCVFHSEDNDLFNVVRNSEISFFQEQRAD